MQPKRHTAPSGFVRNCNRTVAHGTCVVSGARKRRGTVLVFCIFITALLSLMALGILDSLTIHSATVSAVESNEKADYLAEAGVQHALSVLETNPAWNGTLRWNDARTRLPADKGRQSYVVTVNRNAGGQVTIASQGVFMDAQKTSVMTLGGAGGAP